MVLFVITSMNAIIIKIIAVKVQLAKILLQLTQNLVLKSLLEILRPDLKLIQGLSHERRVEIFCLGVQDNTAIGTRSRLMTLRYIEQDLESMKVLRWLFRMHLRTWLCHVDYHAWKM